MESAEGETKQSQSQTSSEIASSCLALCSALLAMTRNLDSYVSLMPYKRLHVYYSGRVQGVGFRYTVRSIAAGLDIIGWARNLVDGRVEVVGEGEEEKLKEFLDNIKKELPAHYIKYADIIWEKPARDLDRFEIRF